MAEVSLADAARAYEVDDLLSRLGLDKDSPAASSQTPSVQIASQSALAGACDGFRTDRLTSLAGRYLRQGLLPKEVEFLCLGWNSTNTPPLAHDKVRDTVASIARTHARNHPAPGAATLSPLFDIADANIGYLLATEPIPRRWLLTDMLPLNIVGMLVAPGGTGKSQLMLQLGIAVAANLPLCELWPVGESGKTLLLFAEDDMAEVHRRLRNTMLELVPGNSNLSQALEDHLFIKSLLAQNNLMTQASAARRGVESTNYVDKLLLTVAGITDLKLIVIDPASRFRGGDENSSDDVTRFVEQLERVREATGATILVCHHANKAGLNPHSGVSGQAKGRGSSAMTDGVRWQANLEYDKSSNGAGRSNLKLEVVKSNYTKPMSPAILVRKDSGYLTAQHPAGVPSSLEDRILLLVADEAKAGRLHTANAIVSTYGGAQSQLQAGEISVRKAIKALVASGKLVGGNGRKIKLPRGVSGKPLQLRPLGVR